MAVNTNAAHLMGKAPRHSYSVESNLSTLQSFLVPYAALGVCFIVIGMVNFMR